MHKILIGAAAAAALFSAGAANAGINVSIWVDQTAAANDATLAQAAALGAPSATTTVGALNFSTSNSDATTIDQFLGTSLGGAVGGHLLDNTYFLFTGSTFLNAGDNSFVVPHDDGLQLNIDGLTPSLVVDAPGPTAEVDTPFTVNAPAAGLYTFELSYGECCGGPAVIRFDVNGAPAGVPEPATWAMMLAGFGGLGAAIRNRRAKAALAY
jgi:hypothetical protein